MKTRFLGLALIASLASVSEAQQTHLDTAVVKKDSTCIPAPWYVPGKCIGYNYTYTKVVPAEPKAEVVAVVPHIDSAKPPCACTARPTAVTVHRPARASRANPDSVALANRRQARSDVPINVSKAQAPAPRDTAPRIRVMKEPVIPLAPRVDTVTRVVTVTPPVIVRRGHNPWPWIAAAAAACPVYGMIQNRDWRKPYCIHIINRSGSSSSSK